MRTMVKDHFSALSFEIMNSLRAGDDIKMVQENLGHATASFTLSTYAHATPGMKKESAKRMTEFIRSVQGMQLSAADRKIFALRSRLRSK